MKKHSLILTMCLLFSFAMPGEAQEAQNFLSKRTKASIGPVARFYTYNAELNGIYGFSLSPQFNIINTFADISLSLDLEPMFGYHPGSGSDSVKFFYGGSPATLNLNIGHLATKDFRSDLGFFAGAGYSADFIRDSVLYSPVATAGLRWWTLGRSFTFRYHVYFAEQEDYNLAHSLGLLYNFGPWLKQVRRSNKLSKFASPFI